MQVPGIWLSLAFSRKTCDGETDSELDKFQPPHSPCCVTWITCLTSPSLVCRWEDHHVPHGMMLRVTGHLCLKLQVHCNCTQQSLFSSSGSSPISLWGIRTSCWRRFTYGFQRSWVCFYNTTFVIFFLDQSSRVSRWGFISILQSSGLSKLSWGLEKYL